ncbi:MAG: dienelactone hydrolase family protein [Corynebacterium sp.]|nr:dienelactone hydrolase family protein [Corynebacterium sp.]
MAENLSKLLSKLSKRGPHRVLVGNLDYVGLPGKIYTPAEGNQLPAIAFGHDWLKDVKSYHATLRHFASWGIVVAAPNTEKGFNPNHRGFASDLETCLQIVTGVKLGTGHISVAPGRLGVVGHGMGGGAAILTAAGRSSNINAVVAAYPSAVTPSAEAAAALIKAPGLILGSGEHAFFDYGNPAAIATKWRGPVAYREIQGANQSALSSDPLTKLLTGQGSPATVREKIRGLITGFLLATLNGDKKYAAFTAADAYAKKVVSISGDELTEKADFTSSST